ncbi:MAG: DUF1611 domain-containing protein [Desulfobacterales bacterium]|nr:MAG: DUF1611 domain-containing protein [Desulfobacterales bacterium]
MGQKDSIQGSAVIITNGLLTTSGGKTAHGLIRGTNRFKILGVIDPVHAGRDAGEVLDGQFRNIPIFPSIQALLAGISEKPAYGIIGVALSGGRLPEDWRQILLETMANRICIVNGLHQALNDDLVLREAAARFAVEIVDIRKPPPLDQLHFWNGEVLKVKTPKIAVLGMDCAIGKRTTCRFIQQMCQGHDIRAEMIYTGQTGWMQGYPYGFLLDATPNDFVSGEIEKALVDCARRAAPDLILIEGQSGLRNPAGPCGSEILLSGNVKGVILVHAPFRVYFDELEEVGCLLPAVEDEISLIAKYGAETLAVALNGDGREEPALIAYQKKLGETLKMPVVRPLQEGVDALLPVIRNFMQGKT